MTGYGGEGKKEVKSDMWVSIQKMKMKVAQSCLTLCDPMDYPVHGILQATILAWVAFPFSRGSCPPGDQTEVSRHCRQILYQLSHQRSPYRHVGTFHTHT